MSGHWPEAIVRTARLVVANCKRAGVALCRQSVVSELKKRLATMNSKLRKGQIVGEALTKRREEAAQWREDYGSKEQRAAAELRWNPKKAAASAAAIMLVCRMLPTSRQRSSCICSPRGACIISKCTS